MEADASLPNLPPGCQEGLRECRFGGRKSDYGWGKEGVKGRKGVAGRRSEFGDREQSWYRYSSCIGVYSREGWRCVRTRLL